MARTGSEECLGTSRGAQEVPVQPLIHAGSIQENQKRLNNVRKRSSQKYPTDSEHAAGVYEPAEVL